MSERVVDREIAHLDFPVEEKKEHYSHPTNRDTYWCGAPRKPIVRPGRGKPVDPSAITCADCLHLYIEKGGEWWWRVNRAWYGD